MPHLPSYDTVDMAYPFRLRGTNQQTDTGILWPGQVRELAGFQGATVRTAVAYASLHNRSGGAAVLGIGVRIPNARWRAGQWTDAAGTPYSDDTTDAQDAGASDFALETTTANDGFVIACDLPFNAISINVGTASVGAGAVRAARYGNTAGDGWTDFANLFVQDAATGVMSTGENVMVWSPPLDWGLSGATGLGGAPQGRYVVNVRATTAPTTAALATAIEIFRLYLLTEAVADNGTLEFSPMLGDLIMSGGTNVVALFSGTADNQNRVTALIRAVSEP